MLLSLACVLLVAAAAYELVEVCGGMIDVLLWLACVLLIAVGVYELIAVFRRNQEAHERLAAEIEELRRAREARKP